MLLISGNIYHTIGLNLGVGFRIQSPGAVFHLAISCFQLQSVLGLRVGKNQVPLEVLV